jgi:Putative zinc-finger
MEHHEAKRLMAVEKYLLDELPPQVRDEFEEHYFDCDECTTDLRATAAFLDAAKREFKNESASAHAVGPVLVAQKKSRFAVLWRPALVLTALAASLLVIAYQNVTVYPHLKSEIARLNAPEILPSVSLVGGNSRGGQIPSVVVHAAQPFLLFVDIPTQDRFSSYTCLLYSPFGALAWRVEVSAQQAKDTLSIRVPAIDKIAGNYTLLVRGNTDHAEAGVDLVRYHFALTRQD